MLPSIIGELDPHSKTNMPPKIPSCYGVQIGGSSSVRSVGSLWRIFEGYGPGLCLEFQGSSPRPPSSPLLKLIRESTETHGHQSERNCVLKGFVSSSS